MQIGFGVSFYGFFVFAAVWCALYLMWATRTASSDRDGPGTTDTADSTDDDR